LDHGYALFESIHGLRAKEISDEVRLTTEQLDHIEMEETPLYSSRLIKNYLEYLKNFHPGVDINPIIKGADMSTHQLEDGGHWFTQSQLDRFHDLLAAKTGNANISREAGRYAPFSKASGAVSQYALGFITPLAAYAVAGKLYPHLSRAAIVKSKSIASNKIEIDVIPKLGLAEKPYQCENRIGTLEAIAKLFTTKFAHIEHPLCLHKGADLCKYIITWEETSALHWKRLKNYVFLFSFILCAGFLLFFKPPHWDAIILLYIITLLTSYTYTVYSEKTELIRNISIQGDAAERLLNQINQRYNESMLVREIGQATSMILDIDKLLQFVMESLRKRLDFDRGMIMLVNKERTHLIYRAGFGYHLDMEPESQNIEFHLDKPESKGVVVETFRQQKPCLVDDITKVEDSFSDRSRDFSRQMGVNSFICIPIVFEQESMGVLMVDNIHSKRPLTESDMSLLMGIAPQVAISITNATSFEKTRASEERFRALSENAPDIIYTLDEHGAFTYVNPAWERILGHAKEEVVGQYFVKFVKQEDIRLFNDAIKKINDKKQETIDLFGILLHKNGSERLFNMSGAPNLDADGNVIGAVGTFKDITELKRSEAELQISFNKLKSAMSSTIDAISLIVESRDPYTAGHQRRVASLAIAIAEEMKLSEDKINEIRMGGLIHDIGKIYIPAEILTKPGRLSKIEFDMMKSHPEVGYKILQQVDFIPPIAQMVYQHHERMDGSGYPLGISGDDILLESRIIAVADSVEAMASHRPYRPALGIEKALEMILNEKGKSYDSQIVDACLTLFKNRDFQFPQDSQEGMDPI
jgi:PAS domain S-box-containing protein/putative nucleotidyltransferase with HDIG domain